ncbi:MAG: hypothetical protein ABID09_02645 [Candidatus Omnitrophota bacterium]
MRYTITKVQLDNVISPIIGYLKQLWAKHLGEELKFEDYEKSQHQLHIRKLEDLICDIKGHTRLPHNTKEMFKVLEAEVREDIAVERVDKDENALFLHCEICSQEGKRISNESKLAIILEDKIRLPLDISMFSAFDPERGVNMRLGFSPQDGRLSHSPFNHPPWVVDSKVIEEIRKEGGPHRLLTNKGYMKINQGGIVKREWQGTEETPMEDKQDASQEPPMTQQWVCPEPDCFKSFSTKIKLQGHMNWHKRRKKE